MNTTQIYNQLQNQVIGLNGNIVFSLGNISVLIEEKDIVGNCIQSWLRGWFLQNGVPFATRPNTQVFPDFIINPNTIDEQLLEVKAWNYDATPAFDIANFQSYCNSLETNANRLEADYLIFGYRMVNSNVEIVDIFLHKIWEISGRSKSYPVKVQVKRNMIYNLRPVSFHRPSGRLTSFGSRKEFVEALYNTLLLYPHTSQDSVDWMEKVEHSYLSLTGMQL